MRILIVEDDSTLGDVLLRHLRQAGYEADLETDGTAADAALEGERHDLVILDIGLPGLDGLEVLRRIRARTRYVPVLVLTARDALEDRIRGLDLGADDYLVKPFALGELEARLRAVVRRGQAVAQKEVAYGSLVLDISARRALHAGQPMRLTGREWNMLEFLVLHAGKMVRKEQIAQAAGVVEGEVRLNSIEVGISRLRTKLEPTGIKIRSIRGFGYYLEQQA